MSDHLLKTVLRIEKKVLTKTFFEPGAFWTSSFAKIAGPVTFLLYNFK
jgi:hypothetical protein